MNPHFYTKALVRDILANPGKRSWTLQGFGMLRSYIGDSMRLHVWDDRYRVEDVTLLHDHPWDFESLIVAGCVSQFRYRLVEEKPVFAHDLPFLPFIEETIVCGTGGHATNVKRPVHLIRGLEEVYGEGQTYEQAASEIHESLPVNGTVTLIERTFHPDTEHARVYYREEAGWVSAEPRAATDKEIHAITTHALETWF